MDEEIDLTELLKGKTVVNVFKHCNVRIILPKKDKALSTGGGSGEE